MVEQGRLHVFREAPAEQAAVRAQQSSACSGSAVFPAPLPDTRTAGPGFSSAGHHDLQPALFPQLVDHRAKFSMWWVTEFKTIKFPSQGTIFDYYIDPETKKFETWSKLIPQFDFDPEVPLQVSVAEQPRMCSDSSSSPLSMSKSFDLARN